MNVFCGKKLCQSSNIILERYEVSLSSERCKYTQVWEAFAWKVGGGRNILNKVENGLNCQIL